MFLVLFSRKWFLHSCRWINMIFFEYNVNCFLSHNIGKTFLINLFLSLFFDLNLQGVPKKRTFRIAIKSSLKSILGLMTRVWPAVLKAADWQAILKVVFLGHPVYIFRKSQMNYGPKTQLKMFTRFLKKKSCNFNPLTPSHILLCSFKIWVDVSVSFVLQVLVRLFFL